MTKSEIRTAIAGRVLAGLMANPKFETHCGYGDQCTHPAVVALEVTDHLLMLLKKRKKEKAPEPVVVEAKEEDTTA